MEMFCFSKQRHKACCFENRKRKKKRKKKKNEKRRQRGTLRTRKKEDLYFAGFK